MALPAPAEGSNEVAARVLAARDIQLDRARRLGLAHDNGLNATAYGSGLEQICALDDSAKALLTQPAQQMALSAVAGPEPCVWCAPLPISNSPVRYCAGM
jgi:magnesium chelatase family protein